MTDDFFRGQSAQMGNLPHKDQSKTSAAADDTLFKDQSAMLDKIANKKRSASADVMDKESCEEKSSLFNGIGNRIFVVVFMVVLLFAITTLGGVIFMHIETKITSEYMPYPDCFNEVRRNLTNQSADAVDFLENCIMQTQQLRELPMTWLFSWSLYATVGYGHRFPFTFVGQLISMLYAWMFIPIYMALKMEFGEIFAICILSFGQKAKALIIRLGPECITRKMRRESYHPSDLTHVLMLFLLFSTFITILATITMATNDALDFWDSFYLSIFTVFQIGLGDVTPVEEWPTFAFVIPLVLVGDALASYLNYYVHGIYRLYIHKMAICVTGCHEQDDDHVSERKQQLAMARSVTDFVSVTNHMMPLRATSAEVLWNGEEQKITTPPDKTQEDYTQGSHRVSHGPRKKKKRDEHPSKRPERSRKQSQRQSHKGDKSTKPAARTPALAKTVVEDDVKTPGHSSSTKKGKFREDGNREHYNQGLDLDQVSTFELKKKRREELQPLLPAASMEPLKAAEEDHRMREEEARGVGRGKAPTGKKAVHKVAEPLMQSKEPLEMAKRRSGLSKATKGKHHKKKEERKERKKDQPDDAECNTAVDSNADVVTAPHEH